MGYTMSWDSYLGEKIQLQVNLDMTDSMGLGKLVRHMQNPSYAYDEYLICIGLGPSISSVICKIRRTVVHHIQVHLYMLKINTSRNSSHTISGVLTGELLGVEMTPRRPAG